MKYKKNILRALMPMCMMMFGTYAVANDIHVATMGNDANAGTEEAPLLTIHKAVELVQPGDRI